MISFALCSLINTALDQNSHFAQNLSNSHKCHAHMDKYNSSFPRSDRFLTLDAFIACLTEEFGQESGFHNFLRPEKVIADGGGIHCSYEPNIGTGWAEILRPFPGVLFMYYKGRYNSPVQLSRIAKKLSKPDEHYMVRLVRNGELLQRFGTRTQRLTAGQGLVYSYPEKVEMDFWPKEGVWHQYCHILFTDEGLQKACQLFDLVAPSQLLALPYTQQAEDKAIQNLKGKMFEQFINSLWDMNGPDHLRLTLLRLRIGELLCLLSGADDRASGSPRSGVPPSEIRKIRELKSILDTQYVDPPSLERLCRQIGLNRRKLTEGFRALYGSSIGAYCQNQRLSKARHLLQHSDLTISEIAKHCGYEHLGNFSRVFRRKTGLTPSQVRTERG